MVTGHVLTVTCPHCGAQGTLAGDFDYDGGDVVDIKCHDCHEHFTVAFSVCRICDAQIMSRLGRWLDVVGTVDKKGFISHDDKCPPDMSRPPSAHEPAVRARPPVYKRRVSDQAWAAAQADAANILQHLLNMPD